MSKLGSRCDHRYGIDFCTRYFNVDSVYDKDPCAPRDADDGLSGAADAAEHVRTRVDAVTTDTVLRIDVRSQH